MFKLCKKNYVLKSLIYIFRPSLQSSVEADVAITVFHHGDGTSQMRGEAWLSPNMELRFNLCLVKPDHLFSHALRVLKMPFVKLQVGCHMPLIRVVSVEPLYKNGLIDGVLLGWLSFPVGSAISGEDFLSSQSDRTVVRFKPF